jgi:hypothetical protein
MIEAFGAVVGGGGTLLTVMYGLGSFKRQKEDASIAGLRRSLPELSKVLAAIDTELNDVNYFSETIPISQTFCRVYRGDETGEAFLAWLEAMPSDRAISLVAAGRGNPTIRQRVADDVRAVESLVVGLAAEFPLVSYLLRNAATVPCSLARKVLSAVPYLHGFKDGEKTMILTFAKQYLSGAKGMDEIEVQFGRALSYLPSILTGFKGQRDFDAMERVVSTVADWVDQASDSELKGLLRDRRRSRRLVQRFKSKDAMGRIREASLAMKRYAGSSFVKEIESQCAVVDAKPDLEAMFKDKSQDLRDVLRGFEKRR